MSKLKEAEGMNAARRESEAMNAVRREAAGINAEGVQAVASNADRREVVIELPEKLINEEDRAPAKREYVKYDPIQGVKVLELAMKGMRPSEVCIFLGMPRQRFERQYQQDYNRGKVNRKHKAVARWDEEIRDGNWDALKFQLKTEHGYVEKAQLEHSGELRAVVSNKPLSKEEFAAKYLDASVDVNDSQQTITTTEEEDENDNS